MTQKDRFFLPHVAPEKLSALQERLETLSLLSPDFLVLLAASTLVATFGMFQNSPAVVIGAMLIAPLMRPLMGLSLATMSADIRLLRRASITLLVGTLATITLGWLLAYLLQAIELTPEIMSRTRPTLLDLGVAMVSGFIGAYCHTNEKLNDTMAGVAIAVALVPPLCVVGVGLFMNSSTIWTGAALLYATNLVGITVAGSSVFLLLGYTPLAPARNGLLISLIALALLVVPLGFSMSELILENNLSRTIRQTLKERTYTFKDVELRNIEVRRFRRPTKVIATVLASDQTITPVQVRLVQDFLEREFKMPIEFILHVIPLTEVQACEITAPSTPPASIKTVQPAEAPPAASTPAPTDESETESTATPAPQPTATEGSTQPRPEQPAKLEEQPPQTTNQ